MAIDAPPSTVDGAYDLSSPFLFATGGTRIIQVQPTSRCNLRCIHCYSESNPAREGEIPAQRLKPFMRDARTLGYSYVGVSGGEPLLWSDLGPFLDYVSDIGFSTSVITNGTLLDRDRAKWLRGRVGLIAVSVDGPPDDHDAIRGPKAFSAMHKGLDALRDAGIPFILVFTLTLHNADRLKWLYEFADKVGAVGVEVHPLVAVGAASNNLADSIPDTIEFKAAATLLALLAQLRGPGGPVVTFDVVRRDVLERSCWPMLYHDENKLLSAPFSEIVPSLVIEPDACVVPFIFGFPRRWALGIAGKGSFVDAAEAWRYRFAAEVSQIVHRTMDRLADEELIDFFGEILSTAVDLD